MTVTTEEAADLAGVDPSVIRKWVLRGDLEPVRRGAKPLRFEYDEVCRVQREKRSKGWRRRHAEAREVWLTGADDFNLAR